MADSLADNCGADWCFYVTPKSPLVSLSSQLSLWNTGEGVGAGGGGGGGELNESFNSFLTRAVIELNSHRRAGSYPHHKPFPPIRDVTEAAAGERSRSVCDETLCSSFISWKHILLQTVCICCRCSLWAANSLRQLHCPHLYIFKEVVQHCEKIDTIGNS